MSIVKLPKPTPYPIASLCMAIILCGYFYGFWFYGGEPLVAYEVDHAQASVFAKAIVSRPVPELLLLLFVAAVIIELRIIILRRQKHQLATQELRDRVQELLDSKKELHSKTHIYASHADKLKLFISDKLLEYIEYDEKFLHFKNIASEVRHNGVISYDKVSTCLAKYADKKDLLSPEEQIELTHATDSIRYLWDLLDLSTADNISLHIANQVCEAEEALFQAELGEDIALAVAADSQLPIYQAETALIKALGRCFGMAPVEATETSGAWLIPEHGQVWVKVHSSEQLLGNENHAVLALENLIANAQFFAGRKSGGRKSKHARIAVELCETRQHMCFQIYNQGPHIDSDTAHKLTQLGFSTRRAKANHGRGLGLYFVNEIAKGYDGNLVFRNIENSADVLTVRLELADGSVMTQVLEIAVDGGKPMFLRSGSESPEAEVVWEQLPLLESIEITHHSDQKTHCIDGGVVLRQPLFDPSQPTHPRWRIEVKGSKNSDAWALHLVPLDIAGVQFELRLPTLGARLDGELLSADADAMAQQVEEIRGQFRGLN